MGCWWVLLSEIEKWVRCGAELVFCVFFDQPQLEHTLASHHEHELRTSHGFVINVIQAAVPRKHDHPNFTSRHPLPLCR